MFNGPPAVLRIKRKRGQDPLQALIFEDKQSSKRSKPSSPTSSGPVTPNESIKEQSPTPSNFYFQLSRTDDSSKFKDDDLMLNSVLSEAASKEDDSRRNFVIPKQQTEEDVYIPHELSDMVQDFMIDKEEAVLPRKKRGVNNEPSEKSKVEALQSPKPTEIAGDTEGQSTVHVIEPDEYVYDVYQLSTTTSYNHPKSQIGYIKFFDEEDEQFNGSEPSEDRPLFSDNEDSNAEDYYQNDYPEDEDADIRSDIYDDNYKDDELEVEPDQVNELYEYTEKNNLNLLPDDGYNSDDDADYVFNGGDDDDDHDDDDDDDYDDDDYDDGNFSENEYTRHNFFDGESDDELAQHRDKIFSRLQNIIDQ